jgi:8-oxo-dGTP pyrophosphatase MutT (NUDIX family)
VSPEGAKRASAVAGAVAVDATTIVLVRDAPTGGIEVLLLERHLDSDFAGGALVFPGGKVDAGDRELAPERWSGADLTRWRELLGADTESDALGLLVAGVRETFEEAGVLFAHREDGSPVEATDLTSPGFVEARRRLASRDERFDWRPWLVEERLVLDLGALAMWSWWVTPVGMHRRFDTRFLTARVPGDQAAAHDRVEMTSLRWMTPTDALAAQARGEIVMIYPTRRNLRDLAAFDDTASLWDAARGDRIDRRRIMPTVVTVDGEPMVQHPDGDPPEPV